MCVIYEFDTVQLVSYTTTTVVVHIQDVDDGSVSDGDSSVPTVPFNFQENIFIMANTSWKLWNNDATWLLCVNRAFFISFFFFFFGYYHTRKYHCPTVISLYNISLDHQMDGMILWSIFSSIQLLVESRTNLHTTWAQ